MIINSLLDYVRNYLTEGYNDESIERACLNAGYNPQDVVDTLNYVKTGTKPGFVAILPVTMHVKRYLLVLLPILAVSLIIFGYFSVTNISLTQTPIFGAQQPADEDAMAQAVTKEGCSGCMYMFNGKCVPATCCKDRDCDDGKSSSTDICRNPGTQHASCLNRDRDSSGSPSQSQGSTSGPSSSHSTQPTETTPNPTDTTPEPTDTQPTDECSTNTDCDDNNACTLDKCSFFSKECSHDAIAICSNDDGCCPRVCSPARDNDCPLTDKCKVDYDCDDNDKSTMDECTGTPKRCYTTAITLCISDDNYCPSGCTDDRDNDCEKKSYYDFDNDGYEYPEDCNDNDINIHPGAVESCNSKDDDCDGTVDEGCAPPQQGDCVSNSDCDDNDASTTDVCSGTPKECSHVDITYCANNDGYCPNWCTTSNDNDCLSCTPNVDCDECSSNYDCDDNNPATTDVCSGTPKECSNIPITTCKDNDNYCPGSCSFLNDNDCLIPTCSERSGYACQPGYYCDATVLTASDTQMCCSSPCTEIETDPCAAVSCSTKQHCDNGICVCDSGYGDCDSNIFNGCEEYLKTSWANCGSCSNQCQSAQQCSNSACQTPSQVSCGNVYTRWADSASTANCFCQNHLGCPLLNFNFVNPEASSPSIGGDSTWKFEITGRDEDTCFYRVTVTSANSYLAPLAGKSMTCETLVYEDAPTDCTSRANSITEPIFNGAKANDGTCSGALNDEVYSLMQLL